MNKMTKKFFDPLSITQANMIPFLLTRMELFGINRHELSGMYDEFMEAKKCELQKQAQDIEFKVRTQLSAGQKSNLGKCKRCGSRQRKYRINISKCTKVDGNYKWAFQCINKGCLHTEYK